MAVRTLAEGARGSGHAHEAVGAGRAARAGRNRGEHAPRLVLLALLEEDESPLQGRFSRRGCRACRRRERGSRLVVAAIRGQPRPDGRAGLVAIAARARQRLGVAALAVSDGLARRAQERGPGLDACRFDSCGRRSCGRVLRRIRTGGRLRGREAGDRGGQGRGERQSQQCHDNPARDCIPIP